MELQRIREKKRKWKNDAEYTKAVKKIEHSSVFEENKDEESVVKAREDMAYSKEKRNAREELTENERKEAIEDKLDSLGGKEVPI